MAITKKGRTTRIVVGLGVVALATLTAFGAGLPASAAPNIDSDPDARGSIIIHKLEQQPSGATLPASTGAQIDEASIASIPRINGVQFQVTRIGSFDVFDNGDWASLPLDPQTVLANVGNEFQLATPQTVTTAEHATLGDGVAALDDLQLGAYLVQEIGAASTAGQPGVVVPGAPFIVMVPQAASNSWLYDVHVYPKSSSAQVTKEVVDAAPQLGLGSTLAWEIGSTSPLPGSGTSVSAYTVRDDLDSSLDFVEGSVAVAVAGIALPAGAFTVTEPAGTGGSVIVTFEDAGIAALDANPGAAVTVTLSAAIVAVNADGALPNTAQVTVNGVRTITSNTPVDHWGSFVIHKYATGDSSAHLQGAVFEIHDAAGEPVTFTVDGVEETQLTTGADGTVRVPGLRTDVDGLEYTIVEVEAPAGYVLPTDPTTAVVVMPGTTATAQVEIENKQAPAYTLPITGGAGQAAFMIGGFGLIAGAVGFMLIRRRKDKAEAQA